jgi:hypothetical protein
MKKGVRAPLPKFLLIKKTNAIKIPWKAESSTGLPSKPGNFVFIMIGLEGIDSAVDIA